MIHLRTLNESYHLGMMSYNLMILATRLLLPNVMRIMLIELDGISTAATTGDNCPCTANQSPITL